MIGSRLGQYEVFAKLGEGGMGEVYRARDTKLGRDVAIKVLPSSFASDPDRRVRFGREARLLAALNHPNIATIHGLEDADGVSALVMELVDGPTLAEKLSRGPRGTKSGLPLNDVLTIARQIADALAAAHDRGIVHRDLKPANLKFAESGAVKVLDFGLAKAFTNDDGAARSHVPTITNAVSQLGGICGTPAYMSPEQARGQAVDAGADIWAFGCVLFEMLTARRAFAGETISDTIAHILERPPDWNALPPATPSNLRRVLAHCLERDPNRRWRDIRDVRIELDESNEAPATPTTVSRGGSSWVERAVWSALVVAGVAAAAFLAPLGRLAAPTPPEIKFDVVLPRDIAADFFQPAISPDGQQLVAAPKFGPHEGLWLRPVGSAAGRTLPNTQNASFPFWSPDGRSIGFFAESKLKRMDLTSEAVGILADAPNPRGGVWQPDGNILFAPNSLGPLSRVSAAGGTPAVVTHLEPGQSDHRGPFMLPDGQHFIYYSRGTAQVRGVWVARLDGSDPKRLLEADAAAVYARGHLLFVREGALFAQAFDVSSLAITGARFRVADRIAVNPGVSLASLSASAAGDIAYSGAAIRRTQFVWVDRSGKRLETLGPPDQTTLANLSLSPDQQRVAFSRLAGGSWDVWLMDMQGTMSRLTTGPAPDWNPVWSSDSRRVFFQSNNATILVRAIDDSTPEQKLVAPSTMTYPTDVSPDGRTLLYLQGGSERLGVPNSELWSLPLAGNAPPLPFLRAAAVQRDGQFSPDGRWVAFQSNQSGRDEIYLQAFPVPGERIPVSSGGGQQVRWSAAGPELFFVGADHQLMSLRVTFTANGRITLGPTVPLFRTDFENNFQARQQYVVTKDGQRFLVNMPTDTVDAPSISLILNWKARASE